MSSYSFPVGVSKHSQSLLYFIIPRPDDLLHLIISRWHYSEVYLSGIWDEIDGNKVGLIQLLAVHPKIFGVPDVSAPPGASSRPVKVFEENAAYFRHVASRFALDADELGGLFYIVR